MAGKTGAVALVEGDIANLTADLAAKATTPALNTAVASKQDTTAKLTAISAMTWAANQILMATGAGTISTTSASALGLTLLNIASVAAALSALNVSAFMQTVLDDANAAAARATLGAIALTDVPPIPVKATATELTTGTDDAKFATALGLANKLIQVNNQTVDYTLQLSDNGKVVRVTSSSSRTITLPNNLPVGFACITIQGGSGTVFFSAASGASRNTTYGNNNIDTQNGQVRWFVLDNSNGVSAAWFGDGNLS